MLTRPTCFLFSVGGLYGSQAERWEALGLGACELVVMPHEDACKALATTSALERFELLLESLRRAVSELDAATIDAILKREKPPEPDDGGPPKRAFRWNAGPPIQR